MTDRGLSGKLSRRELLVRAAGAAAIAAGPFSAPAVARAAQADRSGDLALVNGRFVDGRGVVASALTIRNGRIVDVGQAVRSAPTLAESISVAGR